MADVSRSTNEFKKAYTAFKAALPSSPNDWSEAHFERGVQAAIRSWESSKEFSYKQQPTKG